MATAPMGTGPRWIWQGGEGDVRVRFAGRSAHPVARGEEARPVLPDGVAPSWLRQVHSATVLEARPGEAGAGDALVSGERGLGLTVVTADCVPVLLAAGRSIAPSIAAVHAGWRGIVAGVVAAAVGRLGATATTAWIGPAIGPCCYAVGDDVAAEVVGASDSAAAVAGPGGRTHLDLPTAVAAQLARAGVRRIVRVGECTRCAAAKLWSYRRDGAGTGRNVAAVWLTG